MWFFVCLEVEENWSLILAERAASAVVSVSRLRWRCEFLPLPKHPLNLPASWLVTTHPLHLSSCLFYCYYFFKKKDDVWARRGREKEETYLAGKVKSVGKGVQRTIEWKVATMHYEAGRCEILCNKARGDNGRRRRSTKASRRHYTHIHCVVVIGGRLIVGTGAPRGCPHPRYSLSSSSTHFGWFLNLLLHLLP